ncbi:MAG: GNAT family N-acetyltransferase [Solirubrobacterales bacterium]
MSEEIHRRAIDGLDVEIELFGGCSDACSVIRREGVVASVSPPTPDRSLFNSVVATGPEPLARAIDELASIYADAGVRAWTVWVPDYDRRSAELLAARGHVLDAAPRTMGLDLGDLSPPAQPLPDGVELVPGEITVIGSINDRAYGIETAAWEEAMEHQPDLELDSLMATVAGEPVACAIVLDHHGDAAVTAVATLPEHRGRGLAGWIITELLRSARGRGLTTGSLQASRAGAPVYERLGFADAGFIELWELREA